MTEQSQDARHQTYANIEAFWRSGHPTVLPLAGEPFCEVRLDPRAGRISLATTYQRPEPEVSRLQNLLFSPAVEDGRDLGVITVKVDEGVQGPYGLLAAIADGIQIGGHSLASATNSAVERYRAVLAQRSSLSEHVEIGLFGELLLLRHVAQVLGPGAAIDAWQGPLAEEHDFTFGDRNVEVKSTTSERRQHVISGLSQLVPVVGVPLFLLSIQLTRGTPDSGRTLPALIADVRNAVGGHTPALDHRLRLLGWRPEDADLYTTFWARRSEIRAYEIGEDFPALTSDRLAEVVPNPALVSHVTYTVDVTDMESVDLPEPIRSLNESGVPNL